MLKIKELREKQANIVAQARSLLESIKDDTPAERASELEAQHDAAMAEFDRIGEQITRLERMAKAEDGLEQRDSRRPRGEDTEERSRRTGGDDQPPAYKDVFRRMLAFGVTELSPEERSVLQKGYTTLNPDEVTPEMRAMGIGTGAAGGFTVPQEFSGEIERAMKLWGPMWDPGVTREMNTGTGADMPWPTLDDTGQSGAQLNENTAVTDDGTGDPVFGQQTLKAYVFSTKMVRISIQSLQDSAFDLEGLVGDLFGERLGRAANTSLTTGTGVSTPQGIVTGASVGKTAASATAITFDELIDAQHSVDPAYRDSPKCRWMFNDSTLQVLRKLKDGQGNYLWQQGDVKTGAPNMILDKPYSINQAMDSIGAAKKPVLFGDLSRYVVRKVLGYQTIVLRERYAEFLQIGMVGFKRFDGRLLNSAAVKVLANP